mmetsp:Transcript_14180/g.45272  ORF Transcript_14180/g.45272 Transcript_14180/m.45272 type:complete len:326 (+) Transcript_14180:1262-2239(+)
MIHSGVVSGPRLRRGGRTFPLGADLFEGEDGEGRRARGGGAQLLAGDAPPPVPSLLCPGVPRPPPPALPPALAAAVPALRGGVGCTLPVLPVLPAALPVGARVVTAAALASARVQGIAGATHPAAATADALDPPGRLPLSADVLQHVLHAHGAVARGLRVQRVPLPDIVDARPGHAAKLLEARSHQGIAVVQAARAPLEHPQGIPRVLAGHERAAVEAEDGERDAEEDLVPLEEHRVPHARHRVRREDPGEERYKPLHRVSLRREPQGGEVLAKLWEFSLEQLVQHRRLDLGTHQVLPPDTWEHDVLHKRLHHPEGCLLWEHQEQ